jgi:hypothetical protein
MMAFWSPEAVARAARLDDDPHGFIRAAADFIADRLQRADATAYLSMTRQRRATA